MDISKYRAMYNAQKNAASQRGIDFQLSFQEWCDFWGEDIERRGSGHGQLQMQRFADSGPYAVGNIRKGTPKQNAATASKMRAKRECDAAAAQLQIDLDRMMNEESAPERDDDGAESVYSLGIRTSSQQFRYRFAI